MMSVRYESLARTGVQHRMMAVCTSRSGVTQMLVASGDTPRAAHDAVDKLVDALSPEWWLVA
jgi:hypothetical protein